MSGPLGILDVLALNHPNERQLKIYRAAYGTLWDDQYAKDKLWYTKNLYTIGGACSHATAEKIVRAIERQNARSRKLGIREWYQHTMPVYQSPLALPGDCYVFVIIDQYTYEEEQGAGDDTTKQFVDNF